MSDISLEKMDLIRERTGLNYKEAKELLESANGDVLEALIAWEETKPSTKDTLTDIAAKIKDALRDGQEKTAPHVDSTIKYLREKYAELHVDERVVTVRHEAEKHASSAIAKVRALVSEGKVSKICVKHDGKMLLEVPVASWGAGAAVAAAVLMPELAVVAILAKVFKLIEIEVIKDDGTSETIDINQDKTSD